jgi:hypothetical protein
MMLRNAWSIVQIGPRYDICPSHCGSTWVRGWYLDINILHVIIFFALMAILTNADRKFCLTTIIDKTHSPIWKTLSKIHWFQIKIHK